MRDDYKLVDTIILNGKIEYCATHDDADETIGIKMVQNIKRLNGEIVETEVGSFPLTKEMENKCGWSKYVASVQMLIGDTPIDTDHINETKVVSMEGIVDSKYYHRYSDLTGYLWTEEGFKVGGHDIPAILQANVGKYIYMEIELYENLK